MKQQFFKQNITSQYVLLQEDACTDSWQPPDIHDFYVPLEEAAVDFGLLYNIKIMFISKEFIKPIVTLPFTIDL